MHLLTAPMQTNALPQRGRSNQAGGARQMPRVEHHRSTRQDPGAPAGILSPSRRVRSGLLQEVFWTSGGFHVPSRIDGGDSLGQYNRIISTNPPFGAGSQFGSLSLPGDSFWT